MGNGVNGSYGLEFQYTNSGSYNHKFGITTHTRKKFALVSGSLALLIILGLLLWARLRSSSDSTAAYSTTMQLSGTPGAAFSGEYVHDGKRVAFSGVLPWSMTESNISRLEIHKAKMEDTLVLDARGGGSTVSAPSGPDSKGIRLKTEGGWRIEFIR